MSFFFGVTLGDDVHAQVSAVMAEAQVRVPARWLRPEKLHLTLAFVGQLDLHRQQALGANAGEVCATQAPLALQLEGVGGFVTARAPSLLWLGVAPSDALSSFRARLVAALALEDTAPWQPHLTLARSRTPAAFADLEAELAGFRSAPFTVRTLCLFENTHAFFGARASWPLAGGPSR
jgi:2'-5' RNA ligase